MKIGVPAMTKVDKEIEAGNASWSFENVAPHFDDHVKKSVPLYTEGHDVICHLSDFFLPKNAVVTELGVSTAALAEQFLRHNAARPDLRYVGIDIVESMIERARQRCAGDDRIELIVDDVLTCGLPKSNMILSYYMVQFVPPRARQDLINRIYEALEWGGAFLLFEKVRAPDARFQDIMAQVYQEYKLQNEFSETEILNKQRSLKGVLEPFSTQGNLDLLRRAGFSDIMTVMKYVCFEGFLAIK
jgi:tRNA (cmo5U34)-methyltransferase